MDYFRGVELVQMASLVQLEFAQLAQQPEQQLARQPLHHAMPLIFQDQRRVLLRVLLRVQD